VSVFAALTVTPGIKTPEGSEIFPETEGVFVWLLAGNVLNANQRIEITVARIVLFMGIPPDGGAVGTAATIYLFHTEVNLRHSAYIFGDMTFGLRDCSIALEGVQCESVGSCNAILISQSPTAFLSPRLECGSDSTVVARVDDMFQWTAGVLFRCHFPEGAILSVSATRGM